MSKYDDLLYKPHHVSRTRKQMSQYDRAAQFAPFAALTGNGEAINETGRIVEKRKELTEEEKDIISSKLFQINERIKERIEVTIIHFVADKKKEGGCYKSKNGIVKKIDDYEQRIVFEDKTKIKFEDLLSISSEIFEVIEE